MWLPLPSNEALPDDRAMPPAPEAIGVVWLSRTTMVVVLGLMALVAGCAFRSATPASTSRDATLGLAPADADWTAACGNWEEALGGQDATALGHDAYAELSPAACYVRVHHGAGAAVAEGPGAGCGYPGEREVVLGQLERSIARYEGLVGAQAVAAPMALGCALDPEVLHHGATHNAATLHRLAVGLATGRTYPYSAIATFGFGHGAMSDSVLVGWRPGQACPDLSKHEMNLLGVMSERAGYAAQAYWGRVAPVVIVSGGAVHASLIEAHALGYLLHCRHSVPLDAILLDPCADHTHTNIRNAGGLVVELGGRTAYLVTDQGYQGGYLQEWNPFHLVGGSIDQRALRDWGYLLGAWRQASVGIDSGFWFTPYRFWAEPVDGAGSFTCVR